MEEYMPQSMDESELDIIDSLTVIFFRNFISFNRRITP
jgi:hypothetical protein